MSKNNIKMLLVIIGTIIGAGFASGKEIYKFFVQFGSYGIYGVIISSIITGFIIYFTTNIIYKKNILDNIAFIKEIKGNEILYNIINIFLLAIFYIMIAGFSGYFKQEFNIPQYISSFIFCIFLYIVLINKIDGIIKTNIFLVPILVIFMLFIIAKYSIVLPKQSFTGVSFYKCIIYSILYSSYNSIILIPILISLKLYVKSKKDNIIVSIFITLFIFILTYGLYKILLNSNINLETIDIPIVSVINNKFEKIMYLLIIQTAIFTSAISAGYGVLENVNKKIKDNKIKYKILISIMCVTGIPVSYIGFGNLINLLYPIFGILGLVQIILILNYTIEKNIKN